MCRLIMLQEVSSKQAKNNPFKQNSLVNVFIGIIAVFKEREKKKLL